MMRRYFVFCMLFALELSAYPVYAQQKADKGYKLVWADEFNVNGPPNAANWKFEQGFVRNHELQWYTPQNATCSNGLLVIEAKRDTSANPGYDPNSKDWKKMRKQLGYTSSSLKTSGLHAWQYGRFEMRARFDSDAGMWPAFWTLGTSGEWPSCGEIDIMEYYRGKILANIACGTAERYKAKWFSNTKTLQSLGSLDWSKQFHTWRMDWDENAISLYVDDLLLNTVKLSELNNANQNPVNPFKQPHYVLLNLAIGGDNGGDPTATEFPKKYEVDYVRIYQKQ